MDVNNGRIMSHDERMLIVIIHIINICVSLIWFLNSYNEENMSSDSDSDEDEHVPIRYSLINRIPEQIKKLRAVIGISDEECIVQLRVTRGVFSRLCHLLEHEGGLKPTRNTPVKDQVAIFLAVLAHHRKNRVVASKFDRAGRTVSSCFHKVLNTFMKLHPLLLVQPELITDQCNDNTWKYFKNCLGAFNGSYINVIVPKADQVRYRNRKGHVSVNVFAVCDIHMNFVYVLSGWEGSANDSRVLRDAINKQPGFKIPRGCYYLCDGGYPNGEGFLAPYRGVRYHLKEWGPGHVLPRNKEEYFNMKHARARSVIESSFGVLKSRWGILRSPSYYPIQTQNRIILACCLLHNFIRSQIGVDPEEEAYQTDDEDQDVEDDEYIEVVNSTPQSTSFRNQMATTMYNEWMSRRRN